MPYYWGVWPREVREALTAWAQAYLEGGGGLLTRLAREVLDRAFRGDPPRPDLTQEGTGGGPGPPREVAMEMVARIEVFGGLGGLEALRHLRDPMVDALPLVWQGRRGFGVTASGSPGEMARALRDLLRKGHPFLLSIPLDTGGYLEVQREEEVRVRHLPTGYGAPLEAKRDPVEVAEALEEGITTLEGLLGALLPRN